MINRNLISYIIHTVLHVHTHKAKAGRPTSCYMGDKRIDTPRSERPVKENTLFGDLYSLGKLRVGASAGGSLASQ